jgi:hypothetical protein
MRYVFVLASPQGTGGGVPLWLYAGDAARRIVATAVIASAAVDRFIACSKFRCLGTQI